MVKDKTLILIVIVFIFISCDNEDNAVIEKNEEKTLYTLSDDCKVKFNRLLSTIDFGVKDSTTELFSSIKLVDKPPFLMNNFYTQEEINDNYYFFKLSRNDKYVYLALSKEFNDDSHEFYFLEQFPNGDLINENHPFKSNLSFLNDCSVNISKNNYQMDTVISKENIYLKKMNGLWFLDSVQNSINSNLEYSLLSIDYDILNPLGVDTVHYFDKKGDIIISKGSDEVLYDKVFVSSSKLVLFKCGDSNECALLYYSRQ